MLKKIRKNNRGDIGGMHSKGSNEEEIRGEDEEETEGYAWMIRAARKRK